VSQETYYLTTPLYYVNAPPHLGHAYTTVLADCLARYQRMRRGRGHVFFLTGTDEHGQKIRQAATEAGKSPQQFADDAVPGFQALWNTLNVSYDDFIRTTEPRHTRGVQAALSQLLNAGDVYKGAYEGWYCTPCETFWPNLTVASDTKPSCPDCRRPVEHLREENYFFRLEKYRAWLIDYIHDPRKAIGPVYPGEWIDQLGFIRPTTRRNEVLEFLKQPLQDLCISRPAARLSWGIPMPSPPFEPGYVTYVWFDALLNYITAIGYPDTGHERWARWPADVHLIGKDILRPHAVYWPIMLHALGLPPPRTIAVHGWWLAGGEKMSKSRGNVVDPNAVIAEYGVDAYRYFLMREVPFGQDGTFSEAAMDKRYTSDLANDLGNLVYRTLTMLEKYFQGVIPDYRYDPATAPAHVKQFIGRLEGYFGREGSQRESALDTYDFHTTLSGLWHIVTLGNQLIDAYQPWVLAKRRQQDVAAEAELQAILGVLADALRALAVRLWPFLPTTSEQMWTQLGCPGTLSEVGWDQAWQPGATSGHRIRKDPPLFPRVNKNNTR